MTKQENHTETSDESAEMYDSFRIMTCICPVCGEKTDVDFSQIPSGGLETECTACGSPILIKKSTFAQKDKRKSSHVNCTSCGNLLQNHQRCDACGAVFPDFYEAVKSSKKKETASSAPQKISVFSILLITILLLATSGMLIFSYLQKREQYIDNYFKLLHTVRTGIELNTKKLSSLKPESAGNQARLNNRDEATLNRVRTESQKLIKELGKPPAGLVQPLEKLMNLHKIYLESDALAASQQKSKREIAESLEGIESKRNVAEKELKTSFNSPLKNGLEKARIKYRGLKEF